MAYRALIVGSIGPVAIAVIHGWINAGHKIAAFWRAATPTNGPIRRDRRLSLVQPRWSLTALARRHGFPIRDVSRLASWPQAAAEARATGADVLISAHFRYLVPVDILEVFGSRAVNFHPAPLPRYRGPDPIAAMVLDRTILTDGAMTLHALNARFDEGPIIAQEPVAFPRNFDIWRYHLSLAQAAARLAGDALPRYLDGDLPAVPQDEAVASYVKVAADGRNLNSTLTADDIRWRCATVAKTRPVRIAGVDSLQAIGFRGVIGPPSGEPPAVGPLSIAFDAADARVRLWRKLPLATQLRRLRRFVDLARTPIIRSP